MSGTRRRFTDDGWDIDLTYICMNRVIVMSFPASGPIQTKYRNDYHDVKRFLDERHPGKYWVFNLSE